MAGTQLRFRLRKLPELVVRTRASGVRCRVAKVFRWLVGLKDHAMATDPFHGSLRLPPSARYWPGQRFENLIFRENRQIAGTADFGDVMCSKDTQLCVFPVQGRERDTPGVLYRNRPAIDGQEDGILVWGRRGRRVTRNLLEFY